MRVEGWRNFFLLGVALVAVLGSGLWHPGVTVPFGYGIERPGYRQLRKRELLALDQHVGPAYEEFRILACVIAL